MLSQSELRAEAVPVNIIRLQLEFLVLGGNLIKNLQLAPVKSLLCPNYFWRHISRRTFLNNYNFFSRLDISSRTGSVQCILRMSSVITQEDRRQETGDRRGAGVMRLRKPNSIIKHIRP